MTPPIPGTVTPRPRQYTYADVASLFGVSEVTVKRWTRDGRILSPNYIGSTARWTQEQFDQLKGGPALKGTYTKAPSPRSAVMKKVKAKTKKPVGKKARAK